MKDRNCESTCKDLYPDEMSVDEFVDIIQKSLEEFRTNLNNLNVKPQHAENWIKTMAAWYEMV